MGKYIAKKNKVIVLTDERCGGTSFGTLFSHNCYRRIDDPFNTVWNERIGLLCLTGSPTNVDNSLDLIYNVRGYDYAKCCHISHDLESYSCLIRKVSRSGIKIIYLHRDNYLQRAVSKAIAYATNTWDISAKTPIHAQSFSIDIQFIERQLDRIKRFDTGIAHILQNEFIDHFDIEFLEIFDSDLTIKQRRRKIRSIFNFVDNKDVLDFDRLDPVVSSNHRLNATDVYRRITNIDEVMGTFSNDVNGYLDIMY